MRTLVYKMTHTGDPDPATGAWGGSYCMGQVRGYEYDAVIGIGGLSGKPVYYGIACRIVWIGIGPHKTGDPREPLVTFDHFLFHGSQGAMLQRKAPILARHVYGGKVRLLLNLSPTEHQEVERILASASNSKPSFARTRQALSTKTTTIDACERRRAKRRCPRPRTC